MSRPEKEGPPELFYNEAEAKKYTHNSRIVTIQAEMTERAIQLMELEDPESALVLDIGCGSGISGNVLTDEGIAWIGLDISEPMLRQAQERKGDLILGDMGAGLPFTPGVFDGAISISAVQWLCHANRTDEKPMRRLLHFFQTLFSCLASGARAVFQFYPENPAQAELICEQAKRAGFNGGLVVDYPDSQKNKKIYLVCVTSGIQRLPKALTAEEEAAAGRKHVDNAGRRVFNTGKQVDKRKVPGTKEWIEWKKQRQLNRGPHR
ncbi:Ribosome biogenesis methyltransferase WBSCR22 [Aphelenchoides fujianensis]|nr:Ribosome biogenesis methyltransferase WBSCR22 [Aphelenchoides fujianensis]